jgi:hypothetical protein
MSVEEKGDRMEGWEENLRVQIRRLEKYHQGMLAEGHEHEVKEDVDEAGQNCGVGAVGVGVEADKA